MISLMWQWSEWRRGYATNHVQVVFVYWECDNKAQFIVNDWVGIPEGAD